MTRQKITTQKVHKVLKMAGFVSRLYKPSARINRPGYDLSTYFRGVYIITPHPYKVNDMMAALTEAGIKNFEKNTLIGIEIFQ